METFWYATRVGLVKHKSKQEIDIVLRNGDEVTLTDSMVRILRAKVVRLPKGKGSSDKKESDKKESDKARKED